MKRNLILPITLMPIILLGFIGHKTIEGLISFEKDFYFIGFASILIIANLPLIKNLSVNIIDIILFLFTGYVIINNYEYINSSYSSIKIIFLFIVYFIVKQLLVKDSSKLKFIYSILILSFSLYIFHGFLQYYGFLSQTNSLNKVSGYYSNPAPYAGLLIALIGFLESKLILNYKMIEKKYENIIEYILFIIFLIGITTIIFTKSRAAFTALVVSSIIALLLKTNIINKIKTKWSKSTRKIIIISSVSMPLLFFFIYFLRPDSAYGRLVIWKIALLEMFSKKPIFGHGIDEFQNHYMSYQAQYFKNNLSSINEKFSVANTPYAFNEFVKILVEEGVVGFTLFSTLIILLFYFGFRKLKTSAASSDKEILSGALISLTAIIVFSNFSYPFHDITFQGVFYVIIAIISSQIPSFKTYKFTNLMLFIQCIIISLITFVCFYKQYDRYLAFNIWRGSIYYNKDIDKLEKVKPLFKKQGLFYIHYADALYGNNQKSRAIETLEEGKKYTSNPTLYMKLGTYYDEGINNIDKAQEAYKQVSFSIPYKFYPKYKLLKMFERNNLKYNAYLMAKEIKKMPIKIQSEALQDILDHADKIISGYEN